MMWLPNLTPGPQTLESPYYEIIPTSARTDSCILAAGSKGDREPPLMRRLADERSRVSVHGLTGIRPLARCSGRALDS